jgi:ABC-type glycerol-3-phosphate transport system permease component
MKLSKLPQAGKNVLIYIVILVLVSLFIFAIYSAVMDVTKNNEIANSISVGDKFPSKKIPEELIRPVNLKADYNKYVINSIRFLYVRNSDSTIVAIWIKQE